MILISRSASICNPIWTPLLGIPTKMSLTALKNNLNSQIAIYLETYIDTLRGNSL